MPLKRAPEQGVYVQNGKGDVKGVADWRVTLYYAFCPGQGFLITNLLELFRLLVIKNESAVLITKNLTTEAQRHRGTETQRVFLRAFVPLKGYLKECFCGEKKHHSDVNDSEELSLIAIIRAANKSLVLITKNLTTKAQRHKGFFSVSLCLCGEKTCSHNDAMSPITIIRVIR